MKNEGDRAWKTQYSDWISVAAPKTFMYTLRHIWMLQYNAIHDQCAVIINIYKL